MANGMDSDGYVVVSTIPKGFKRELARLLKTQTEGASFTGRRVTRSQNSGNKRLKVSSETVSIADISEDVENGSVIDVDMPDKGNEPVKVEHESKEFDVDVVVDESKQLDVISVEEQKSNVVHLVSDDEKKFNLGKSTVMEDEATHEEKLMLVDEPEKVAVEIAIDNNEEKETRKRALEPLCEVHPELKDNKVGEPLREEFLSLQDDKSCEVLEIRSSMSGESKGLVGDGFEGGVGSTVLEVYTRRTHGSFKKGELSGATRDSIMKEVKEIVETEEIDGAGQMSVKDNTVKSVGELLPEDERKTPLENCESGHDTNIDIPGEANIMAEIDGIDCVQESTDKKNILEAMEERLPEDEQTSLVENHVSSKDSDIDISYEAQKNGVLIPVSDKLSEVSQFEAVEQVGLMEVEVKEAANTSVKKTGKNPMIGVYSRRMTRGFLKSRMEISEGMGKEDLKEKDEVEADCMSALVAPATKLEMKMSKKVVLKKFPAKLKELLNTGLLEGLPVWYIRGSKAKGSAKTGIRGVIKGTGVLCFCDRCNGTNVVTPVQFELHAGSGNKRPPEYIFLENGNSLRDVLNACKEAPSDTLEAAIQIAIGYSHRNISIYCLTCKGPIPQAGIGKTMLLCNSCMALNETQGEETQSKDILPTPVKTCDSSDRSLLTVSEKTFDRVFSTGSVRIKGHGRLTRKDVRMHKLVFEEDVLPDGTALAYYSRGQKLLEGYKKGLGIFCFCCDCEVSPSQFEAHAGMAARRKPFHHIFTSNGMSLHELSINLSKVRKFSAEENDDLCSICADGGDLLCCDNCPRAFHRECISLPNLPQDTWYCKYCQNMFQKEKFVERNANAIAAGRIAGIDPMEQITQRCIRIVESLESEASACVLCRSYDFSNAGFWPRTVIICDQCEKEYHVGCLKEHEMDDLKELPTGKWFCCADCNRIHSVLQNLVADGEKKLPDLFLSNIKKKQEEKGLGVVDHDIRWRILSGKIASDETRVLLSKAVSIFHDRFDPIADSSTSRLDLIPPMVYGRKLKDQEFGGMYCAILTVNLSVVSAGIIRIFGKELAELPLVATSINSEGQGYFQTLFSCIENLLGSLNVNALVLPAADEAESLWINKCGFTKITPEQLSEYRKDHQPLIFQGTSVLHKAVPSLEVQN